MRDLSPELREKFSKITYVSCQPPQLTDAENNRQRLIDLVSILIEFAPEDRQPFFKELFLEQLHPGTERDFFNEAIVI